MADHGPPLPTTTTTAASSSPAAPPDTPLAVPPAPAGFIPPRAGAASGARVHGNFAHYYNFNAASARLSLLPATLLAQLHSHNDGHSHGQALRLLDVGCNSGDLTASLVAHFQPHCTEPIHAVGWDIDPALIAKARHLHGANPNLQFEALNVSDEASVSEAASRYLQGAPRFHLVSMFAVTMWLHIFAGDDGLAKIIKQLGSCADAMIVEPQLSRCYKTCRRRLSKAGVPLPPYLNELELRGDALQPGIHKMFTEAGFPHAITLGDTKWERSLILYTRTPFALG